MVAVVLGSAFARLAPGAEHPELGGRHLEPVEVSNRFGVERLYRWPDRADAWVLFRHGAPHRLLPHQINWRAQAAALAEVGAGAVLLQSAVGVMDAAVPLFRPLLAADLIMLDNRLPDGTLCTVFAEPTADQGHLVVEGGLFDAELSDQVASLAAAAQASVVDRVTFSYVPGPRTKTPAENTLLGHLGGQTNSMTVGPETVLLNELGVPVAALLVGHKHSLGSPAADGESTVTGAAPTEVGQAAIDASLARSRAQTEAIVVRFLNEGRPVPWKNRLHRL